mgnify:CR=1 FL=1
MGTRSLTKVIQKWEDKNGKEKRKPITCMYRQYDGHIDSHGQELAEFLEPFTVVNGMGLNEKRKIANGMDCLAAQLIAYFKKEPGNIYLMHPDSDDVWEEYLYEIEKDKNNELLIIVYSSWNEKTQKSEWTEIFHGTPTELLEHINVLENV